MRLKGKAAVVTGGTRGLGRAVASAFLDEGCKVMYAAREPAAEIIGPCEAVFHPVDVRQPDSVRELMNAAVRQFSGLDILVANAGTSRPGRVGALSYDAWAEVIDTNLTGVFTCISAALPHLEQAGDGRIITLSSALAARPAPAAAAYGASKAGLEMLTRVAALETAARGVTINCLSPGFIDEGMGRALAANEQVWPHYQAKLASGRMGTAQEVAAAAVFLASSEACYINGHVLEVNGGLRW
jgi:3-oxoacyl-[acyl-carrier protein] reductase